MPRNQAVLGNCTKWSSVCNFQHYSHAQKRIEMYQGSCSSVLTQRPFSTSLSVASPSSSSTSQRLPGACHLTLWCPFIHSSCFDLDYFSFVWKGKDEIRIGISFCQVAATSTFSGSLHQTFNFQPKFASNFQLLAQPCLQLSTFSSHSYSTFSDSHCKQMQLVAHLSDQSVTCSQTGRWVRLQPRERNTVQEWKNLSLE